ncbi:MAG: SH3 domain-containing protein [Clostridia bacterium]|nr:SH3 domain-containing protein [Clostridia bacterium]
MKKNCIRALALYLVLALLPALALASEFAVVKGGRLNLRQYPSTDSYSLGKYDTGTWVLAGNESNGWYEVKMLNGKRGYMSSAYLDFGTSGGSAVVKYANGNYVNLRSGPSTDAAVIMRVPSGSTFHIQSNYSGWCYGHVNVGSQTVYGYMYETFLGSSPSTAVVTTQNGGKVNVRSGPDSSYSAMGKLASGTQVSVLLKGNGWYKISGGGMEGFMSTQYLSGTGATLGSNTGTTATTTSQTAWVNNPKATQVLNLRETPSQSARSIGQYRNGTKVKVVSKGATWCEVYVGTRHGYMMTRYLSFDGNYIKPTVPDYTYPDYTYPGQTHPGQGQPPHFRPSYPTVTPTPTPVIQHITPKPQKPAPAAPKAGDTVTLAIAAGGSSNLITVYHDASLTQSKASYAHGKQVMMLQYGTHSCMIYVDGGVAYVSTWNVNY